jgi:endogenous inhibitor of DNA gyrase (YacG/DUF329 family)
LFDADRTEAFPFCSQRCRHVDLGRWLNEEHGVPVDATREAEPDDLLEG